MKTNALHIDAIAVRIEDSMSEGRIYPLRALLVVGAMVIATALFRAF